MRQRDVNRSATGSSIPARGAASFASGSPESKVRSGWLAAFRTMPYLVRVVRVLARHGILRALRGRGRWPAPASVREALEELGVAYIKFGQVLALRRDLLPDEYIAELEQLHDRLPPLEFALVREAVQRELNDDLEQLFRSFDPEPLAAATIAQVHAATLPDGRAVVVKVLRPGLEDSISETIAALTVLAAMAERFSATMRSLDMAGMVGEFGASLRRETDFHLEARAIQRFRVAFVDVPAVWIPDVIPERSAAGVLTMEHSPGLRVDVYAAQHPAEKQRIAASIASLVLHQIFENGLFQADPHPGNVFVLPDGRICLHDFGMVGELDPAMRDTLVAVLEAVVRGDARALTDAYLELGLIGEDIDRASLETELTELLRQVREQPLEQISVGAVLAALLRTGSRHHVRNPAAVLLLVRAFLIAEGLLRSLDPGMDVLAVFRAEMERVALRRHAPAELLEAGRDVVRELERVLKEAPRDVRRALRRIGDGELGRIRVPTLERLARRGSRDVERLTGAVVSAALVVAGALLVGLTGWHRLAGDLLLLAGVIGSLAVAWGALRKPRE